MRTLIAASLAIAIIGPALAQTQRTYSSAYATIPTLQSAFPTSSLNPCRSSINPTSPCYTGGPYPFYSALPAEILSAEKTKLSLLGADKLSEAEVMSRIKEKGYLQISQLKKDPHGVWRGSATLKNGTAVKVTLDLQGNIYSQPNQ